MIAVRVQVVGAKLVESRVVELVEQQAMTAALAELVGLVAMIYVNNCSPN